MLTVNVRTTKQRIADVYALLEREVDAWVASASEPEDAYLIPLSFAWDGSRIIMATPGNSLTARNLSRAGWARIAIGPTRDVAIIEGALEIVCPPPDDPIWEIHAAGAGFDAREAVPAYVLLILAPHRIQTWRTPAELRGRDVMRAGQWLAWESLAETPD